jgi:hypothetical protein
MKINNLNENPDCPTIILLFLCYIFKNLIIYIIIKSIYFTENVNITIITFLN